MSQKATFKNPDKLAHIAWCAITALQISKIEKLVPYNNRISDNKYIGYWAKKAILDGRFESEFNQELLVWQNNGLKHPMTCNLLKSLTQIVSQYSERKALARKLPGSYKRRIDNAVKKLTELGWTAIAGLDRDWDKEGPYSTSDDHTAFITKEHMECFDNLGRLTSTISLMVISNNVQPAVDMFYECGLFLYERSTNTYEGKKQYVFDLTPGNTSNGLKVMFQSKHIN